MDLVLFGLNHTTAPVEIRERLSFKASDASRIMQDLCRQGIFFENLLLSTCNRTEIYGVACRPDESLERLHSVLSEYRQIQPDTLKNCGYTFLNIKAVQHLFRVAAGLDSMVLGEVEILGQLKDAYRIASEIDVTGPFLNRFFQHCFRVGKRVRTETSISIGSLSVGSVAVNLAVKVLGRLEGKKALIIGAGETGQLVARQLANSGVSRFTIANRTRSKAEELAREFNGDVIDFENIGGKLTEFDLVITAVGAPERTITPSMVQSRRGPFPLFIDLGVPCDIDPEIDRLPGVIVYNIDDLQTLVKEKAARRELEIPRVEKIIKEETAKFIKWHQSVSSEETLTSLRNRFESIRQEILEKWRKHLNPHEQRMASRITEDLIKKILHAPTQNLKGCELGTGTRKCEKCDMFDPECGPVHGHYNQALKLIFARMLFELEEKDPDA